MIEPLSLLLLVHLIGLALGLGAATVKMRLLLKAKADPGYVATYLAVNRPVTHVLISGLILLTLSGIVWIIIGTTFSTLFIIKLILVLVIWIMGPVIDNVLEPKYKALAADAGNRSAEFNAIQNKLLTVEFIATADFYIITIIGILL